LAGMKGRGGGGVLAASITGASVLSTSQPPMETSQ
jgi:hypothetical protein